MNPSPNLSRESNQPALGLFRPWHIIKARLLARKIRRQHCELAKFVRRSAYEINAWKQDIGYLEEQLGRHLALSGNPMPDTPDSGKVVSMKELALERAVATHSTLAGQLRA